MVWADGGGAEEAEEMLMALSQQDWPQLKSLCSNRGAAWRACLASILRPQQGELAEHLLLDLAWDQEAEVAFLAMSGIAFYCGVNDSAIGPFIDLKIRNSSFFALAKATMGLREQIRRASAFCHPRFQRRFGLLTDLLESGE
jgi:hypothetical protein